LTPEAQQPYLTRMSLRRSLLSVGTLLTAVACGGSQPPAEPAPGPAPVAELPPAAVETSSSPAAAAAEPEAAKPAPPTPAVPALRYAEGLATPESVLYDVDADRYLVSNINGKPLDVDGNGYIADFAPNGMVNKPKFIAGGVNNVKLDAPKGLGLWKGVLYVSDITVVRKFDAKTGAPKGEIKVPGATFLNDIAVASDGKVYVSDSGLKAGAEGFEPTGSDAVYVIDKDKVKALAKSKELSGPNGLLATPNGLLVVTFGSNELFRLDDKGARQDITKLPEGGLDGLVALGDSLLVTSWKASSVYRGKLGGEKFEVVLSGVKAPADMGYDTKRSRVLLPRFMENAVEVYDVK